MQEEKIKYYTNSKGEKINIKALETTHLTNAISKKCRELFEAVDIDDYEKRMNDIEDLRGELYERFNTFKNGMGDKNV